MERVAHTLQTYAVAEFGLVFGDTGINASRIVLTVDTAAPDIHQRLCLGNVYQVRTYINNYAFYRHVIIRTSMSYIHLCH